ncbi:magnesium transporter CorA family protein [Paenibacillus dakarensis]|uniref:magnesium transporter CorA family protein n=1 Tax=Paenibacillus dakarensis TaxID=1527293 RepID=UPI0009EA5F68|nr:magnesium transporter CorA family protein [Paenibacillus dakarensis]
MNTSQLEEGHNIYSFAGGWKWYDLQTDDWNTPLIGELRTQFPNTTRWLDLAPTLLDKNYLSVFFPDGIDPVMMGTILYTVVNDLNDKHSDEQFYFYVDDEVLITFNMDEITRGAMRDQSRVSMMHQCASPIEGMFVLSRVILHYFHAGMDKFEHRLRKLESEMRKHNKRYLMDSILTSRFELIFWNNLFVSFQELITASKEGYLDRLDDSRFFKQLLYRVERMEKLFRHYEQEIDTLVSIDDAIAGFRGNEIMKTLTIMTVIFTPATVVGAIWGMNFDNLPLIKFPWGFTASILLTLVLTVGMYIWMHMKGWTGDILRAKSRDKNI